MRDNWQRPLALALRGFPPNDAPRRKRLNANAYYGLRFHQTNYTEDIETHDNHNRPDPGNLNRTLFNYVYIRVVGFKVETTNYRLQSCDIFTNASFTLIFLSAKKLLGVSSIFLFFSKRKCCVEIPNNRNTLSSIILDIPVEEAWALKVN